MKKCVFLTSFIALFLLQACSMKYHVHSFDFRGPTTSRIVEIDQASDKELAMKEGDVIASITYEYSKKENTLTFEDSVRLVDNGETLLTIEANKPYPAFVQVSYKSVTHEAICIEECSQWGNNRSVIIPFDETGKLLPIQMYYNQSYKTFLYPQKLTASWEGGDPQGKLTSIVTPTQREHATYTLIDASKYAKPKFSYNSSNRNSTQNVTLSTTSIIKCGDDCYIALANPDFEALSYVISRSKEKALSYLDSAKGNTSITLMH